MSTNAIDRVIAVAALVMGGVALIQGDYLAASLLASIGLVAMAHKEDQEAELLIIDFDEVADDAETSEDLGVLTPEVVA